MSRPSRNMAQPYAPPYPPAVYGPIVTVRADNPRARLQVMGQLKWQDVCLAPCNMHVHPAGSYRIGGGTIRASETFNMPRQSGPVLIEAEVGSKVKRGVGIGLTIGGGVSALAGGIYLAAASSATNDGYYNGQGCHAGGRHRVPGGWRGAAGDRNAALDEQHVRQSSLASGHASGVSEFSSICWNGLSSRQKSAPRTLVIPGRSGWPSVSWKNSRWTSSA